MKYKIGIVYSGTLQARCGGPSTYLYNLKKGLRLIKSHKCEFYCFEINNFFSNNFLEYIFKKSLKCFEVLYIVNDVLKYLFSKKNYTDAINKKILHFHSSNDLFYFKKLYRYKGNAVLTMHAPEPYADEVVNFLKQYYGTEDNFILIRKYLSYVQKIACKNADAFIFPTKESEEVYKKFDFYRPVYNKSIVKYLITGSDRKIVTKSKEEIRFSLGIKEDGFVVSYLGRHIQIKGYDMLINSFNKIKENNIFVVCAGQVNPKLKYPKNDKWIELGWINNTCEILKMSDVLVLPNKSTYFDLVAIEALEQGCIIVASNTGGNITLGEKCSGVILFDIKNQDDFINKICYIKNLSLKEKTDLKTENYKFYKENCVLDKFASNYINTINEICNEIERK